jgi:hypothetical protein
MKIALCSLAVFLAAPAAMADEFCDDLKAVLKAGDERPAPYDSLVNQDPAKKFYKEKLASFVSSKPIRGLPEGAVCSRYLAGVADGVIGGGTHNYIRCDLGRADENTRAQLDAKRDAVAKQIGACLGASGWKTGQLETASGGRVRTERIRFTPPSGAADIVIEAEGASRITRDNTVSTSWMQELQIRTPSLFVPPPKPQ